MSRKRYYTVGEANETLRRLEPIVRALSRRALALRELRPGFPGRGRVRPAPDTPVEPVYYRELEALVRDLQEVVRHGCEVKDLQSGIIDFPALLRGRTVFLCWRLGEAAISHWHEVDAGFQGRQPIDPDFDAEVKAREEG